MHHRPSTLGERRSAGRPVLLSISVLVVCLGLLPLARTRAEAPEGTREPVSGRDLSIAHADANHLDMLVSNRGSFAFDWGLGAPGLVFPRGSDRTVVFAAGLWLGARVDGDTRVALAEYDFEFVPGALDANGTWDPNWGSNPHWRTYKIRPGDTPATNPDYAEWPVDEGAPADDEGNPLHLGAQTLWSVYHDADPNAHTNNAGGTEPLGVEVQATTFALAGVGAPAHIVFLQWGLTNQSGETWSNAYVAGWADPDVGGSSDDLVGCDPARSLGYAYNATNGDDLYGASPPAVGLHLVQGPIVQSPGDIAYVSGMEVPGYRNLPMTAFSAYINGTDPTAASQVYNCLQGLWRDGSPVIDPTTGERTTFAFSGDPVTGEGWIDSVPGDRRMMISSGPFDLLPGETQTVAVAVIVGQGPDRLGSVTALRAVSDAAVDLFRSVWGGGDWGACCFTTGACRVTTQMECLGVFYPGETCLPNPCLHPIGACCFDNGICLPTRPDECPGAYLGDGSVCLPGVCPEYGPSAACCLDGGRCETLSERHCLESGGIYLPETDCGLFPPGDTPGWQMNNVGGPMFDETLQAGNPVPPDGRGGPGDAVWHSYNSTREWVLSAGGGDGSLSRFTRNGDHEENLTARHVELRWDHDPDSFGWWVFDSPDWMAAPIPFGLYEVDPVTGEEQRLLVFLYSGNGTVGEYDISAATPDGRLGWPATDWAYAYTGDFGAFLADARDGRIDDYDHGEEELFARLVFASEAERLPVAPTVIRFVTKSGGLVPGSGFASQIPLGWEPPAGQAACFDSPTYRVYRDDAWIGDTQREDFLDTTVVPGQIHIYTVRTENPINGELSAPSVGVRAMAGSGHVTASGSAETPPILDGMISPGEWSGASIVDASPPPGGAPHAQVRIMNDAHYLYLAVEDGAGARNVEVYLDPNGNGQFDRDALDGVLRAGLGGFDFVRATGAYPNARFASVQMAAAWVAAASTDEVMELRLDLGSGPLAERVDEIVPMFVRSVDGVAVYPRGPGSVLREAPWLFARVALHTQGAAGSGEASPTADLSSPSDPLDLATGLGAGLPGVPPALSGLKRSICFPTPFVLETDIAFHVPHAGPVWARILDVSGSLVRTLVDGEPHVTGVRIVRWDGRDQAGRDASPGVYFHEVRGAGFRWTGRALLVR